MLLIIPHHLTHVSHFQKPVIHVQMYNYILFGLFDFKSRSLQDGESLHHAPAAFRATVCCCQTHKRVCCCVRLNTSGNCGPLVKACVGEDVHMKHNLSTFHSNTQQEPYPLYVVSTTSPILSAFVSAFPLSFRKNNTCI